MEVRSPCLIFPGDNPAMLKVLSVFGTRPEAVKMAPVVRELARRSDRIVGRVCVTAQHREMLDQVLDVFGISPDHDLNLMTPGQSPTQMAAAVLKHLEPVLRAERPDWVLVQGDTTTVMAAAIAAFYSGAKVGHVEAGLRSFDRHQPFPEEINRRLAGVVADLHFVPTDNARRNLLREGVDDGHIRVTGNTVIDALHWAVAQPAPATITELLDRVGAGQSGRRVIVVTAHRRENFGAGIEHICQALRDIAIRYGASVAIVYPVHLNPNIIEPAQRILASVPHVHLVPPLDYLPMVHLMRASTLVLTDSGGLQEEAPGLGKPVLVLRDKTERPEALDAGTVKLVGARRDQIVAATAELLDDADAYRRMARALSPYGDGHAAERIVSALLA